MQTRSRTVEMPSGLSLPLAFGMNTRLIGSVCLLPERKRQFSQPPLDPVCLDLRKVLAVDPRRPLVGAALGIGMRQNVLAADLVVQGVEAIAGFRLRFRVTPSAASERFSELLGCPISRSLTTSCVGLELRPLPSAGITRLHR